MSFILTIDTSTSFLSLSIQRDEEIIGESIVKNKFQHAKIITIEIENLIQSNRLDLDQLDAVAISEGPGSFTGLRVGSSTAKGLCLGLDIPLISIRGLEEYALAFYHIFDGQYEDIFIMLDARRDNYFFTHIHKGKIEKPISFESMVCIQEQLQHSNSKWVFNSNTINTHDLEAKYLAKKVFEKFNSQSFEDLSSFEPNYYLNNYQKP